jgi:hypothetical protein
MKLGLFISSAKDEVSSAGKPGRGERIRTSDPMSPRHVRYRTAPRPDLDLMPACMPAGVLFATAKIVRGWPGNKDNR